MNLSYIQYGSNAVLIKAAKGEATMSPSFWQALADDMKCYDRGILDVVPAYDSLLVIYDHEVIAGELSDKYHDIFDKTQPQTQETVFHIPVCYDDSFGMDLDDLAEAKKMSKQEIIHLHTSPQYTLAFYGFIPGFMYLEGLSKDLHFPRLESPRMHVPRGSVGIGAKHTGIYPLDSPGGWRVIGRTPICIFDADRKPPVLIPPGGKVRFYEIDLDEYKKIQSKVEIGDYFLKTKDYD